MVETHEVIIIGGGPSGSLLGYLLAKNGRDVLIIEAHSQVKRKVCGEYLCPMGVQLLNDLNISNVLDGFLDIEGMDIYPPSQRRVETNFPESDLMVNHGKSVNRQIFDERLIDLAKSAGAKYLMGESVKKITDHCGHWTLDTLSGKALKSYLLVGADGRRSLVAKTINATDFNVKSKKVALLSWVERAKLNDRKGQMHIFKDGSYIGVDPTGEYEQNVSLVCDPEIIKNHGGALATINHYIQKSNCLHHSIGHIREDEDIHSITPLVHKVKKFSAKNIALIGDAAGFIDPLTGEGIFNALWTAKALADNLGQEKVNGPFAAGIKRYNRETKKFFFQKKRLNLFFQWLLKRPVYIEFIASYLLRAQKKADAFVGIIGNIYRPLNGFLKILVSK